MGIPEGRRSPVHVNANIAPNEVELYIVLTSILTDGLPQSMAISMISYFCV